MHVKVIPADINLANYEIDILSPIEGTYQNNNLFYSTAPVASGFIHLVSQGARYLAP
jgi:gamma-glutamyltranspeptidase